MAFIKVDLELETVTVDELKSLLVNFEEIKVVTSSGEIVYLSGVQDHDTYTQNGFKHVLKTKIKRNGESPVFGEATFISTDNVIYTGTLHYERIVGGEMGE